jgi:hypothetical protein
LLCGVLGAIVHVSFVVCVGIDAVDRGKVKGLVLKVIRRRGGVSTQAVLRK